jgi:rRNA-processing protein FCF1
MQKVILDTNALLLFGQGIDLFAEIEEALDEQFEYRIPEQVMKELETFAKRKSKEGVAAKLAWTLVQEKIRRNQEPFYVKMLGRKEIPLKTVSVSGKKHADDAIVKIAEDDPQHTIVATLDKRLRDRLLKTKARTLTLGKKGFKA